MSWSAEFCSFLRCMRIPRIEHLLAQFKRFINLPEFAFSCLYIFQHLRDFVQLDVFFFCGRGHAGYLYSLRFSLLSLETWQNCLTTMHFDHHKYKQNILSTSPSFDKMSPQRILTHLLPDVSANLTHSLTNQIYRLKLWFVWKFLKFKTYIVC